MPNSWERRLKNGGHLLVVFTCRITILSIWLASVMIVAKGKFAVPEILRLIKGLVSKAH